VISAELVLGQQMRLSHALHIAMHSDLPPSFLLPDSPANEEMGSGSGTGSGGDEGGGQRAPFEVNSGWRGNTIRTGEGDGLLDRDTPGYLDGKDEDEDEDEDLPENENEDSGKGENEDEEEKSSRLE